MGYRSAMQNHWPASAIAASCAWGCGGPSVALDQGDSGIPTVSESSNTAPPRSCQLDDQGEYHPSLQAAVDAVPAGATVIACPREGGHPGPLILRHDITLVGPATLVGGPGPAVHILDGHVRLVGLELTGGTGAIEPRLGTDTYGGVVAAWDADSLELRDTTISGGTADWGGCVAGPRTGPLVVVDSAVSGCEARKVGGGVWIRSGTVQRTDILDNIAPYGGGVAVRSVSAADGDVFLHDSRLEGNHGTVQGGGLLVTGPASVHGGRLVGNTGQQGAGALFSSATGAWSDGVVAENVAGVGGGGVFITGGQVTLSALWVQDNSASGDDLADGRGVGGGLWVAGNDSTTVDLQAVWFEGNTAEWGAGVMAAGAADWTTGPQVSMTGGGLVSQLGTTGGGAALQGATLLLMGTEVADNDAESGAGVLLADARLVARETSWADNRPADVESEAGVFELVSLQAVECDADGCRETAPD
jgi:hypothetical protein